MLSMGSFLKKSPHWDLQALFTRKPGGLVAFF